MLLIAFALSLITQWLLAQADASTAESFEELGNLFLWGIVGAVGAAVLVAILRIRMLNKRDASSDTTSINPSKYNERD